MSIETLYKVILYPFINESVAKRVQNEAPDFMFMDVVMGEMNGDKALGEIRKMGSDVPIVMLSSVTDQSLIDQCQESGISGFIFKPIQADTGAKIISDYLKIA